MIKVEQLEKRNELTLRNLFHERIRWFQKYLNAIRDRDACAEREAHEELVKIRYIIEVMITLTELCEGMN